MAAADSSATGRVDFPAYTPVISLRRVRSTGNEGIYLTPIPRITTSRRGYVYAKGNDLRRFVRVQPGARIRVKWFT